MIKDLVKMYFKGNGGLAMFQSMMQKSTRRKGKIGLTQNKDNPIGTYLLFGMLMLLFMWMVWGNFTQMFALYGVGGAFWLMQLMTILFAFFFTLTSVDNILTKGNDLQLLFSLPIERSKVFISRFIVLYIEVMTEALIVFIPFIVATALKTQFSLVWFLLIIVDFVVLPIAITMILGLISFLSTRVRILAKLRTAMYVLVMIAVIYIMITSQGAMSQQQNGFYEIYNSKSIIESSLLLQVALAILGAIVVSVILYAICYKLTNGFINIEDKGEKRSKRGKGEISYKRHTPIQALLQREVRIVMSESAFYVELIMESVMPLFLLVIYGVMGIAGELWSVMAEFSTLPWFHLTVCALFLFFYLMNMSSATSVSREGKDFDYSKTFPVTVNQRINAKVIFHELLVSPVAIVLLTVALAFLKASPFLMIIMIFFIPVFNAWISLIGLKRDYKRPHIDWERPQEAVKQNSNALISMVFGLILSLIVAAPIVLSLIFLNSYLIVMMVEVILLVALLPLMYKSTMKTATDAYMY